MHQQVYHSLDIQAWEQRWFQTQNSAYGLMQQAAWQITQRLLAQCAQHHIKTIAVCCGQGNNAGDGYLVAKYLAQYGFSVTIYAAIRRTSNELHQAYLDAVAQGVLIYDGFDFQQDYDCYIDALFGIGLNRELNQAWQDIITRINQQSGFKVAIDMPSGLQADTGQPLPCAIHADITYTILALKAGLFTGKGKAYAGCIETIALIPPDHQLQVLATLTSMVNDLPPRQAFGHKGSYGHVLIVGGHENMGGAVILAAEAAFATGAGKVTVVCHAKHHTAILARAPNIMLRDIDVLDQCSIDQLIHDVDAVAFGMGLGRDLWAKQHYLAWFPQISTSAVEIVLDADALWFLAEYPVTLLAPQCYLTPHPGEAAKLLGCTVGEIEGNRIEAIRQLKHKFQGDWVLKGAGSLILETQLWICTAGNAGMGTGGWAIFFQV